MLYQLAKRKYPRFSKNCEVRYKLVELEDMPLKGTTINISGGGLCFKSDVEIPLGKMVALEIDLPGAPAPVMAMGKLMWVKVNEDGEYENGVEFWWLGWTGKEDDDKEEKDGKGKKGKPSPGMLG